MTDSHKTDLRRNRDTLVQKMEPANVINKLVSAGFLTLYHQETILVDEIRETKVERLLDALALMNDGAFPAFLNALNESGQQSHADLFKGEHVYNNTISALINLRRWSAVIFGKS